MTKGQILTTIAPDARRLGECRVNMAEIDQTFFAEPEGWSLTLQTIPLSR